MSYQYKVKESRLWWWGFLIWNCLKWDYRVVLLTYHLFSASLLSIFFEVFCLDSIPLRSNVARPLNGFRYSFFICCVYVCACVKEGLCIEWNLFLKYVISPVLYFPLMSPMVFPLLSWFHPLNNGISLKGYPLSNMLQSKFLFLSQFSIYYSHRLGFILGNFFRRAIEQFLCLIENFDMTKP